MKLAAYLEEASEDIKLACRILKNNNIEHVAIKHLWGNNVSQASDTACEKFKSILIEEDIKAILLSSDLGKVPANNLIKLDPKRTFNLASFFKVQFVRIFIGTKSDKCDQAVDEWMSKITECSISANVVPVLEITPDSYFFNHADIANILFKHKRWKLLYDPAQLLLRQKLNPFIKYWSLLNNKTAIVEVRDFKIGKGFKPAGFGDTKIDLTIKDKSYNGWYVIEPSLGRRFGGMINREDTFKIALEAFNKIWSTR